MIINLTPHEVVLVHNGTERAFPPSGKVARVVYKSSEYHRLISGLSLLCKLLTPDYVEGLPEPQKGTYYIVSREVASKVHRADLIFPEDFIRDDKGRIVGCRAFGQFNPSKRPIMVLYPQKVEDLWSLMDSLSVPVTFIGTLYCLKDQKRFLNENVPKGSFLVYQDDEGDYWGVDASEFEGRTINEVLHALNVEKGLYFRFDRNYDAYAVNRDLKADECPCCS